MYKTKRRPWSPAGCRADTLDGASDRRARVLDRCHGCITSPTEWCRYSNNASGIGTSAAIGHIGDPQAESPPISGQRCLSYSAEIDQDCVGLIVSFQPPTIILRKRVLPSVNPTIVGIVAQMYAATQQLPRIVEYCMPVLRLRRKLRGQPHPPNRGTALFARNRARKERRSNSSVAHPTGPESCASADPCTYAV